MKEPSDLEMAMTRQRLQEWPHDYLEAVAMHHARVASVACDMQKVVNASKYASFYPRGKLEQMAEVIENSFAEAFGVRLRSAATTEPRSDK